MKQELQQEFTIFKHLPSYKTSKSSWTVIK